MAAVAMSAAVLLRDALAAANGAEALVTAALATYWPLSDLAPLEKLLSGGNSHGASHGASARAVQRVEHPLRRVAARAHAAIAAGAAGWPT